MVQGVPDEGSDDEPGFRAPLPPDDRLWRHPSEIRRGHDPDRLFPLPPPIGLPPAGGPPPWPGPAHGDPLLGPPSGDLLPDLGPRRDAHRSPWLVGVVSGVAASLLTAAVLAGTGSLSLGSPPAAREVVREVVRPAQLGGAGPEGDVVAIAEDATPAIARIVASGDTTSGGSGVILRDDGYVVTNAHVVDEASRITVVLADGREVRAELVGVDTETDIAVVRMTRGEGYTPAPMGTAADLRVGQSTVAIGSPLGLEGGSSVTTGVISQLGRVVQAEDRAPLLDMIQTDAAIAPGSSGGALLDMNGAVIGITTAIAVSDVGAEGLGFAVPIDIARAVADEIIATGRAVHVWLGIEGTTLNQAAAEGLGVRGGAVVGSVVDASPADQAGLEADDVIVAVDDDEVISMSALVIALRSFDPGDSVALQVVRDGARVSVPVTLAERP